MKVGGLRSVSFLLCSRRLSGRREAITYKLYCMSVWCTFKDYAHKSRWVFCGINFILGTLHHAPAIARRRPLLDNSRPVRGTRVGLPLVEGTTFSTPSRSHEDRDDHMRSSQPRHHKTPDPTRRDLFPQPPRQPKAAELATYRTLRRPFSRAGQAMSSDTSLHGNGTP